MIRSVQVRWLSALVFVTLVSAGLIAGPLQSGAAAPQSSVPTGFHDTMVFNNLDVPTAIAFAPDGRVFVAEKAGVIKVFTSTSDTTPDVFADFHRLVFNLADRGLLGLAVDPQLGTAGHNYVYALYTLDAPPGGTAPTWKDKCKNPPGLDVDGCVVTGNLVRIAVNPDGTAGRTKILIKAQWCQQFSSHSVGHLAFGPDGMLYASGGEGASWMTADWGQLGGTLENTPTPVNPCGDPPGAVGVANTVPTGRGGALRAQSMRRPSGEPVLLNGALLRLDPANGAGVKGNPAYDKHDKQSNESRIVAYGFRNPFRFTFRPGTSEIWVADVGWYTWEEIDRVSGPTAKPAPNFGWPCYDGNVQNDPFTVLDMCQSLYNDAAAPATPPYYVYNHNKKLGPGDTCALVGSTVISAIAFTAANSNYPSTYDGALFFGDHSRSCIWVMRKGTNGLPDPSTVQTFVDNSDGPGPVDIEANPATGDLFYVDIDTGSIHRISYGP